MGSISNPRRCWSTKVVNLQHDDLPEVVSRLSSSGHRVVVATSVSSSCIGKRDHPDVQPHNRSHQAFCRSWEVGSFEVPDDFVLGRLVNTSDDILTRSP